MSTIRWSILAILVLLSACSIGQAGNRTPNGGQGDSTAVGPGISINQALASDSNEPLLINGWLLISPQGEVRFCSALGDTSPPTCAGPSLLVDRLDPADAGQLTEAGGLRWSQESIQLLGSVANGRLTVSATSI